MARKREAARTMPPSARDERAIRVSGSESFEPVAGSVPEPTVSVTESTPSPAPQLTETVTVPEALDGTVALKLNSPSASAVPEPISEPLIDAVTVASASAPEPLTVMVWPGFGVVSDTVALQPP
jgi:hypothetical protein